MDKLSIKFEPTTGDSKKILHKKFSKYKLYDVTRNPKERITKLELILQDLQKSDVHIDNSEMMTNIISNLPEEYQNIIEILKYELDDKEEPLTIERIHDKV